MSAQRLDPVIRDAVQHALLTYARREFGQRTLQSPPEENLEVFKRNLNIREQGLGRRTMAALGRYDSAFRERYVDRREPAPSNIVSAPEPRRVIDQPRNVVDQPRLGLSLRLVPAPRTEPVLQRPAEPVVQRLAEPAVRRPTPVPVTGNLHVREQSANAALQVLQARLSGAGRTVEPARVYVVQLDTKAIRPGSLAGRTYVFRGGNEGAVSLLGTFQSSSQPSALRHDESQFTRTANYGPAFIQPAMYTIARRVDGSYSAYGGSFRIPGEVPSFRFGGAKHDGRNNVAATGVLLHDESLGSAACQRIENFRQFRNLVMAQRGHDTFDYVLARV